MAGSTQPIFFRQEPVVTTLTDKAGEWYPAPLWMLWCGMQQTVTVGVSAGSRDAEKGSFPASAAALFKGGEQGRLCSIKRSPLRILEDLQESCSTLG